MNDYLKNQLVKGEHYKKKFVDQRDDSPQVEVLKMEIEYLHEINREKELQIEIYKRNLKKHQRTSSQLTTIASKI